MAEKYLATSQKGQTVAGHDKRLGAVELVEFVVSSFRVVLL
jgi:hypothetical protein